MNSILGFLLIGALAGWLAGNIRRGYGFGLIGNIIVGVCGAFFGGFLFDLFGLPATGLLGSLLMATIGALVLLALISFIRRA
ncbi:MAG TPA: GlsB/YeaQ/YmgE family stress response membrane protein [Synechococcus sp. M44_DOE_062]|nr:GlsB/YeaQ/YmgE family stress response membrane protein [Synechococcus sp. M44_DOE_062]